MEPAGMSERMDQNMYIDEPATLSQIEQRISSSSEQKENCQEL